MRLLGPIIGVSISVMNDLRNKFPVSDSIAAQLIGHDLSGLPAMIPYQSFEEAFCFAADYDAAFSE